MRQHRPPWENRSCRKCTGSAPRRPARPPAAPPAGCRCGTGRPDLPDRQSRARRRGPSAAAAAISDIGLPRWLSTENRAEAPDCSRDVTQFGGLVGRVGRHQNQAGKAAGEFHQHPFRHIRRPNDDAFARRIARGQRRRQPLAVGQQFGEGPTALGCDRRRIDFDQRHGVAALPRRIAQNAADCRLHDDVVGLGRNIGFGEVETVHGEPFRRLGSVRFFGRQFIRIRRARPVLRLSGRRLSAGSARHRSRQ